VLSERIEVIPVIDILNGVVVHAVAGRREEYKPIRDSVLIRQPDPGELLVRLKEMGFESVYIADLDGIMYNKVNDNIPRLVEEVGMRAMMDIGISGLRRSDTEHIEYVVGTEYLRTVEQLLDLSGRVVSLDMIHGKVKFAKYSLDIDYVLNVIKQVHLRKLLFIDLDRVGTMQGPNLELIKRIRNEYSGLFIVGGGVRSVKDILQLKEIGVNCVLIATALHKGIIDKRFY